MILCCGDALIDMLPRTLPDGAAAYVPVAGGASFNTAIALGRLGLPTAFLAGLSTDAFGKRIEAELTEAGVDCSACVRSSRPTTLAFVELANGKARYSFHDEGTAGRMITSADLPAIRDDITAMHFGAVSLVQEPSGTAFSELLLREAGRRVISLDPNIRRNLIDDEDACRRRIRRLIASSDIVKVSDEDLDWIAPERPAEIIDEWIASGPSIVVVTEGERGSWVRTADLEIRVGAGDVEVVDTIGAGDGFDAGFLASLHWQGLLTKKALATVAADQLRKALVLATEIAGIIVSRAGANPPWRREIDEERI